MWYAPASNCGVRGRGRRTTQDLLHPGQHVSLTDNLHRSTGKGVDFFTETDTPKADDTENNVIDVIPTAAEIEEARIVAIPKMIRIKRHLSSFSFRFRINQLEELDLVMDELNQNHEIMLSKNDVVRTAVNWLLADYQELKQESTLARVLTDTCACTHPCLHAPTRSAMNSQ